MRIRRLLGILSLTLVLLAGATGVDANPVVIAGGTSGGSYQRYAVNLQSKLPAFRVTYRGTKGSGENLELLASGKADIGFAQADVYADYLRSEPARFGGIGIVGRLADECVYIAYRKSGRVRSVLDLQAEVDGQKPRLAVGSPEGGMHATWSFAKKLEPAFGATAIKFTEGTLAITHLATGLVDAVGGVTDPRNVDHKLLRAARANDALGILGFDDPDLAHSLDDGTPIYQIREVPVGGGYAPARVRTACTSSMIFTRPGIDPHVVQAVADVLSLQRDSIVDFEE